MAVRTVQEPRQSKRQPPVYVREILDLAKSATTMACVGGHRRTGGGVRGGRRIGREAGLLNASSDLSFLSFAQAQYRTTAPPCRLPATILCIMQLRALGEGNMTRYENVKSNQVRYRYESGGGTARYTRLWLFTFYMSRND